MCNTNGINLPGPVNVPIQHAAAVLAASVSTFSNQPSAKVLST